MSVVLRNSLFFFSILSKQYYIIIIISIIAIAQCEINNIGSLIFVAVTCHFLLRHKTYLAHR